MARVQLIVPDADRDRYVEQAAREGMTFSAWLRAAAEERCEKQKGEKGVESAEGQPVKKSMSVEELEAFFRRCDERAGPGREPDWEESKRIIEESKIRGLPDV